MKRLITIATFIFLLTSVTAVQSCSRKSGCPSVETTQVKTNRKGEPRKGDSSNLFPRRMRRNR